MKNIVWCEGGNCCGFLTVRDLDMGVKKQEFKNYCNLIQTTISQLSEKIFLACEVKMCVRKTPTATGRRILQVCHWTTAKWQRYRDDKNMQKMLKG